MAAKQTTPNPSRKHKVETASPSLSGPPSKAAREMNDPASAEQVHEVPVELVQELAYQKYLARGEGHGSDVQDWLDAEREVQATHHTKSRPN